MIINFYILPNSSEEKISGLHNNEIKIKLRAKPTDGEANKAIIDFLSKILNVPKREINIKRGSLSRHKQVEITVDSDVEKDINQKLAKLL